MNGKIIYQQTVGRIQRDLLLASGQSGQCGKLLNTSCLADILKWFLGHILKDALFTKVELQKVNYSSSDAAGQNATLSGLIITPLDTGGKPVNNVLLGFQHGTQLERRLAPSNFDQNRPLDFMEVLIAAAFAMNGYTVVMADYQGMGVDKGDHPYVNAKPLAMAVGDLLVAVQNELYGFNAFQANRIGLIGYSEGGYVTMAAAREIQSNPRYSGILQLIAAAPLAGPYDLSGTMRRLMLRNQAYGDGYYLPMTIRGFHSTYGDDYGDGIFTKTRALKPQYQFLYDLVDGYHATAEVQKYMPPIPGEILSNVLINELNDPDSKVCQALRENDLYQWTPQMPMYLYHNPEDDRVPYTNSQIASNSFIQKGCVVPVVPMFGLPIAGSVHVKSAPTCFLASSVWLKECQG